MVQEVLAEVGAHLQVAAVTTLVAVIILDVVADAAADVVETNPVWSLLEFRLPISSPPIKKSQWTN